MALNFFIVHPIVPSITPVNVNISVIVLSTPSYVVTSTNMNIYVNKKGIGTTKYNGQYHFCLSLIPAIRI